MASEAGPVGRGPKWFAAPAAALVLFFMLAVATSAVVLVPDSRPTPSAAGTQKPAIPSATQSGEAWPVVRWLIFDTFAGSDEIKPYEDFVSHFNATNADGIYIRKEIAREYNWYDKLKTDIASGNAPDIVGPMGASRTRGFEGLFLDLTGEIERNHVDLSVYEPALVSYYRDSTSGQVALPYVMAPGYIWYNKDLFAKAGLPALPTKVGELYQGQTWDWNALGKIAAQLTLDRNGRRPTDSGFDPSSIVQYGMNFQWSDARRMVSCFGGGSFVAADGKSAQIPEVWGQAFSWYYDAIWKSHFVPTGAGETSQLLADGNTQSSGRVAMSPAWEWELSLIWDWKTDTAKMKSWDIAVMPSWHGVVSSPNDMSSFFIPAASKHPDVAFRTMLAIMGNQSVMDWWGGFPARRDMQGNFIDKQNATVARVFPGIKVSWEVMNEMAKYPALPSHDSNMPNYTQASDDIRSVLTRLKTTPGLNVQAELAVLKKTLQADFDAVQPLN